MDLIPINSYYGISFSQQPVKSEQQFQPGQVIARFRSDRLSDRRSFNISLIIKNKDEVHAFLKSKRGNIPFKFAYDNLAYTCVQYSFTYLALNDFQFDATFIRDTNPIGQEGVVIVTPPPDPDPDPEPTPEPPFYGGQCLTQYKVSYTAYDPNPAGNPRGSFTNETIAYGPIRGLRQQFFFPGDPGYLPTSSPGYQLILLHSDLNGQQQETREFGTSGGILTDKSLYTAKINSVSRIDGLPDNCGNIGDPRLPFYGGQCSIYYGFIYTDTSGNYTRSKNAGVGCKGPIRSITTSVKNTGSSSPFDKAYVLTVGAEEPDDMTVVAPKTFELFMGYATYGNATFHGIETYNPQNSNDIPLDNCGNIGDPKPPFYGGQCDGVQYEVRTQSFTDGSAFGNPSSRLVYGPIQGKITTVTTNPSGSKTTRAFLRAKDNFGNTSDYQIVGSTPGDGTIATVDFTILNIRRIDGLPDNCGNPPPLAPSEPEPPFYGGQCDRVQYNVLTEIVTSRGNASQSGRFFGKILGTRTALFQTSSNPDRYNAFYYLTSHTNSGGGYSPEPIEAQIGFNPNQPADTTFVIRSITRVDGQPDNCGNPPPVAQ